MEVMIGEREVLTQVYRSWEPFGLSIAERRQHAVILGKTGVGKSTLLRNLIIQDIQAGRGLMLLDPHGDLAEELLDFIPPWRTADVVYLDLSELSHPIGLNPLEREPAPWRSLVAANVCAIFRHHWSESWGPRSEYVLLCALLSVLDYPDRQGDVSLLAVQRMLSDAPYRERIVSHTRNKVARDFWLREFAAWPAQFAAQALAPIENKLGSLLSSDAMRLLVGQATSTLRIAEAMDTRKIIIARLPKGLIGEEVTNIAGSLLVNAVQHAAMRRAVRPEEQREDFAVYLDEFSNFTTDSFADILSELRKYHTAFICSSQFISQMRPSVRSAIIGNCGSLLLFQLGFDDAAELAPMLGFHNTDTLTSLKRGELIAYLAREGQAPETFIASTYSALGHRYTDRRGAVLLQSRRRYGMPREIIQAKLDCWSQPIAPRIS